MKFNRDALLAATDKALAEHRAEFDRKEAERASEGTKALAEWLTTHGPKWLDFAEHVTYLVAHGYPVTEDDMPKVKERYYASRVAYGSESWLKPAEPRDYSAPVELVNLRNVLRCASESEVSTTGLKALGVEPMRTVLRFL